jgi:DNA-binding transcriptional LysR family regulator
VRIGFDFRRANGGGGIEPTIGMEVRELPTALSLVASGAGVSILPVPVRGLRRGGVRYIDFDEPDVHSHHELSQERQLSAARAAHEQVGIASTD